VSGSGLVGDTSILVIQEVASWGLMMFDFLQTNFAVTPDVITQNQIAATNFLNYDIVIVSGGQSAAFYDSITANKVKFEAFANAGGTAQYQLGTFGGAVICAGGATVTYGNLQTDNNGLLPAHPIIAGIANPLNGNYASHGDITSIPPGAQIISETSVSPIAPTTVEYDYGNGNVIVTGMPWEYNFVNAYNSGQMLPNSITYGIDNVGSAATWITISSSGDTVAAGDSTIIYVTFNTTGLIAGTYYGTILVNSNDPANPQIAVLCTLTVTNQACPDYTWNANNCNGSIVFISTTLNNPTTYLWDFGDGGTSPLANPTHTYALPGTYLVELLACNATGCDSITYSVTVNSNVGPIPASCYPATTGWCCGRGITNVTFNTINNTSADGSVGYEDFTCTSSTSLFAGQSYTMQVTTGPLWVEWVRAWIDFNNDGVFTPATEQVFATLALMNHTVTVNIPAIAVFNQPLRMRVGSEFNTEPIPAPCNNVLYGQFEDYTIFIIDPTGITEQAGGTNFSIAPNPFTGTTTVSFTLDNETPVSIDVFNTAGEIILKPMADELKTKGTYSIKLQNLTDGIYFIRFRTNDESIVRKMVNMD
jgi:PKD repeat protein